MGNIPNKNMSLPMKVVIVGGLAVLAFWLWPDEGGSTIENSVASTASNALAGTESSVTSVSGNLISSQVLADKLAVSGLSVKQSKDLSERFLAANQTSQNGDREAAVSAYQALINDYPNFVEPYVNLASVLASQGQLEKAREALTAATAANQSTQVLFQSISKVHGALAARAYRNALEDAASSETSVTLPKATQLATDFSQAQKIKQLSALLEQQSSGAGGEQSELEELRSQVAKLEQQRQTQQSDFEQILAGLQSELGQQREQSERSQAQLARLMEQSEVTENDLIAKLRIELANVESALQSAQTELKESQSMNGELTQQLASLKPQSEQPAVVVAAADETIVNTLPADEPKLDEDRKSAAVELVRAWANAWSAQNVGDYVSFYAPQYSSSSALSHQQWLEQRRIRLTNKRFIDVDVSNFKVEPSRNGFKVTFTQHYRSNTLDDTIRKELAFEAKDSSLADWRRAKINGERIVGR